MKTWVACVSHQFGFKDAENPTLWYTQTLRVGIVFFLHALNIYIPWIGYWTIVRDVDSDDSEKISCSLLACSKCETKESRFLLSFFVFCFTPPPLRCLSDFPTCCSLVPIVQSKRFMWFKLKMDRTEEKKKNCKVFTFHPPETNIKLTRPRSVVWFIDKNVDNESCLYFPLFFPHRLSFDVTPRHCLEVFGFSPFFFSLSLLLKSSAWIMWRDVGVIDYGGKLPKFPSWNAWNSEPKWSSIDQQQK